MSDHASPSGDAAAQGHAPRKSGHLHDCRVPPDSQCLRSIEPSPLLPEAATTLLPPIKDYVPGVAFEGTRDVRVLDHARTLQVAVWLHRLDMSAAGDGMASETLEASWHNQGPLLDLFLTPMMGNLTFQEVVNQVLYENRHQAQHSLDDLRACRACTCEELEDLTKAHREEPDKSS